MQWVVIVTYPRETVVLWHSSEEEMLVTLSLKTPGSLSVFYGPVKDRNGQVP